MSTPRLVSPVAGHLSSTQAGRYGWRTHPVTGERTFHAGDDVACPIGTPIIAPEPGRIIYAGWAGSGLAADRTGKCVIMRGDWTGVDHYWGHCSELIAATGDRVDQGEIVAESGNTGVTSGPHVHTEVRTIAGTLTTTAPAAWFADHGATLGAPAPKGSTPNERNEDDMPALDDKIKLNDSTAKPLGRKEISYDGATQYAAAGGWLVMQNLPELVTLVKALRSEVAALRKEIKK